MMADATSDAISIVEVNCSSDVIASGANGSVANTANQAVAVTLSDVTVIDAISVVTCPGISEVIANSMATDSEPHNISNGTGLIDGSGLIITASAISSDGAAMVMTDLASFESVASVTFFMGSDTPINANVEIETWPTIEANWNAQGVDVAGADGTVIDMGVGVIISDVVEVNVEANIVNYAEADIDGISTNADDNPDTAVIRYTSADIIASGATVTDSNIVNHGANIIVSGASLESVSYNTVPGTADIIASGATTITVEPTVEYSWSGDLMIMENTDTFITEDGAVVLTEI